jgi:DNA modification methylase
MRLLLEHERCTIYHGNCAELGSVTAPRSVDAIVTDPPAGISFMGKKWDRDHGGRDAWIAAMADLFRPSFVALKPGAYAFVWAIPRTSHWTAMALEHAGFAIRDIHHHCHATGFPKSLNIRKSLEAHSGTDAAAWAGHGTGLKPAVEHWILARKALEGTYAQNVLAHGTGTLNIDACRIPHRNAADQASATPGGIVTAAAYQMPNVRDAPRSTFTRPDTSKGRWPANLSLEHNEACVLGCPVSELDRQSMKGGGGASRFFFVAKPSRKERDEGLENLPQKTGGEATGRIDGSAGTMNPRAGAGRTGGARNTHPTVKSVALMRWLVRLITPPGGLVLDPFAGSGSTGVAALAEGFRFLGIELGGDDGEYIPILEGRIRRALETP